jgi:hypothetical protein
VDIDSVADELYGLAPEAFVAGRNEREKLARQAGDKELAARIRALAKPNLVAWLANRLARERTDQIESLIELGAALRDATRELAGDRLRELSRQQNEFVGTLVEEAKRFAADSGRNLTVETARGLQDTLHAALADPRAAEQLRTGRLAAGLQRTGFSFDGSEDIALTPPGRRADRKRPASPTRASDEPSDDGQAGDEPGARELEEAAAGVDVARVVAEDAARTAAEAKGGLERADRVVLEVGREMSELAQRMDRLAAEQSVAVAEAKRARDAFEHASRAARDAGRNLDEAEEHHDRLLRSPSARSPRARQAKP